MSTIEDIDSVYTKVKTLENSEIFHLLTDKEGLISSKARLACRKLRVQQAEGHSSVVNYQDELERGHRPCKDCLRHIEEEYDIDIVTCCMCGRISFLHDSPFFTYSVEYGQNEDKDKSLCLNCQTKIETMKYRYEH